MNTAWFRQRMRKEYMKIGTENLDAKLAEKNPHIVWIGGEYEGISKSLDFLCLKHHIRKTNFHTWTYPGFLKKNEFIFFEGF